MKKILIFLFTAWLYIINYSVKVPLGLILWLRHNVRYKDVGVLYGSNRPM